MSVATDPNDRFDILLAAMVSLGAKKKPSADPASNAESVACSSDTQTRPNISEDASR